MLVKVQQYLNRELIKKSRCLEYLLHAMNHIKKQNSLSHSVVSTFSRLCQLLS